MAFSVVREWLLRTPRLAATAAFVGVAVSSSLLITALAMLMTGIEGRGFGIGLAIATVAPLAVATPAGWLIMTLLRDVHEARLDAQRLARTDPLTGTLNRRHFAELAEREFERARRTGGTLALLLLDLDDFKRINDNHGHAAGDAVLKAAAAAVAGRLRMVDVLARWGGEEFVVLLPGTPQAEALRVAERLREAVLAVATPIADGHTTRTSTSIGVAVAERGTGSLPALVAAADQAMYAAKQGGRNRVAAATAASAPATAASAPAAAA